MLFIGMMEATHVQAQLAPLSAFGQTHIVLDGTGTNVSLLQSQLSTRLNQPVLSKNPSNGNVVSVWVSSSERSTYIRCTTSDGRSQQSTAPRNDETLVDDVIRQIQALNVEVVVPSKPKQDPPYPLVAFNPAPKATKPGKLDDLKDWMPYVPKTKPTAQWTGIENAVGLSDPK